MRRGETMTKEQLGDFITQQRKAQGMTQKDLAQRLHVTDKAVSKWERDLACPDVNSLPKLAQLLGVSVDELMQIKTRSAVQPEKQPSEIAVLICKAVPLAMGVAVLVLSLLKQLDLYSAAGMLGIGLIGLSILNFIKKNA